jgi:carboxymethylenebutenolidase
VCYSTDSAPPIDSGPAHTVITEPLTLTSADGTRFAAFAARPDGDAPEPRTGVVVLPDVRGLAPFYTQLCERLAVHGHPAVAVDWYGRTAGTDVHARPADFPDMPHLAALTRERQQDDVLAAAVRLRHSDGGGCAHVVALGFCMGGRAAFLLSAPRFGFAGVVGFYGAPGIAGPYGPGPTQHAAELGAPILGLFGGADEGIPPEAVAEFDAALTRAGVPHTIVTYPGAPHGFFDVAHERHRDAAADAWDRVLRFLAVVGERPPG